MHNISEIALEHISHTRLSYLSPSLFILYRNVMFTMFKKNKYEEGGKASNVQLQPAAAGTTQNMTNVIKSSKYVSET